jgi:hypothetical protein
MLTSQIVARLQRLNPDYSSATLVEMLDSLSKLLLRVENDDNLYYDTTTGDFPYLSTTQGTYQYSSIPNVFKIRDIVVNLAVYNGYGISYPVNDAFANNPYYGRNPGTNYGYDVAQIKINNRLYLPVPCVKTEAYQGETPSVMFRFDPMTQATMYQIMGYKDCTTISSANVQLQIPVRYHETVVIPAMQALIDGESNGRYLEMIQYIEKELKPKIDFSKNSNSSDRLTFVAGGW